MQYWNLNTGLGAIYTYLNIGLCAILKFECKKYIESLRHGSVRVEKVKCVLLWNLNTELGEISLLILEYKKIKLVYSTTLLFFLKKIKAKLDIISVSERFKLMYTYGIKCWFCSWMLSISIILSDLL